MSGDGWELLAGYVADVRDNRAWLLDKIAADLGDDIAQAARHHQDQESASVRDLYDGFGVSLADPDHVRAALATLAILEHAADRALHRRRRLAHPHHRRRRHPRHRRRRPRRQRTRPPPHTPTRSTMTTDLTSIPAAAGAANYMCLWAGTGNECQNCGGWLHVERQGGFEGDPRVCSEDCAADLADFIDARERECAALGGHRQHRLGGEVT